MLNHFARDMPPRRRPDARALAIVRVRLASEKTGRDVFLRAKVNSYREPLAGHVAPHFGTVEKVIQTLGSLPDRNDWPVSDRKKYELSHDVRT